MSTKPSPDIRDDEGFIDIRFVLGRDDDPVMHPYIMRTELLDSRMPAGTTHGHIDYMINEFYDEPHGLVEDIDSAFRDASPL